MAEVQNQKDDLKSSIQELINEAKQALADNDIEKAKQLQSEIESSKQSLEELEKVSDQLDQYESELGTKEDSKVADESTEQPTETPKKKSNQKN